MRNNLVRSQRGLGVDESAADLVVVNNSLASLANMGGNPEIHPGVELWSVEFWDVEIWRVDLRHQRVPSDRFPYDCLSCNCVRAAVVARHPNWRCR
jgi:hypothetical protein